LAAPNSRDPYRPIVIAPSARLIDLSNKQQEWLLMVAGALLVSPGDASAARRSATKMALSSKTFAVTSDK